MKFCHLVFLSLSKLILRPKSCNSTIPQHCGGMVYKSHYSIIRVQKILFSTIFVGSFWCACSYRYQILRQPVIDNARSGDRFSSVRFALLQSTMPNKILDFRSYRPLVNSILKKEKSARRWSWHEIFISNARSDSIFLSVISKSTLSPQFLACHVAFL